MGAPALKNDYENALPSIPGYEVKAVVGQGANGIVYLGEQNGTEYIIKVLKNESADKSALKSFRREAATLARLKGVGVAALKEQNSSGNTHYIVMEYIEGKTLDEYIRSATFNNKQLQATAIQLTELLQNLHSKGYVHGDLKPENIMIKADGQLKLIDVGLAADVDTLKKEERVFGSVKYASPEQLGVIHQPIDFRADLFSLGCILYQISCGRLPIETEDVAAHISALSTFVAKSPAHYNPSIHPDFADIVKALLSLDPEDRPTSANAVLDGLKLIGQAEAQTVNTTAILNKTLKKSKRSRAEWLGLIGRQTELGQLQDSWTKVNEKLKGTTAFVRANSGMGKSRLMSEFLKNIDESNLVLEVKCDEKRIISFYSIRLILDSLVNAIGARGQDFHDRIRLLLNKDKHSYSLLLHLVPKLKNYFDGAVESHAEVSKDQIVSVASDLILLAVKELGPSALLVDDTQWIDNDSLSVFTLVSLEIKKVPLMLIFTSRNEDVYQDVIAHNLNAVSSSLTVNLQLEPLSGSEIHDLLQSLSGDFKMRPEVSSLISEKSGNNPFVAIHFIGLLIDEGSLSPVNGEWISLGNDIKSLQLPASIAELMVKKIDEFAPSTVNLLKYASLMGADFDIEVLLPLTENVSDLFTAINSGVKEQLIQLLHGKTYAFTHDKMREALLAKISEEERPMLNQRLADALVKADVTDFSRQCLVARLYIDGDQSDTKKIFDCCRKAGLLSLKELALVEAKELLEAALRVHTQESMASDTDLLEALAVTYEKLGLNNDALTFYDRALSATADPYARALLRNKKSHLYLTTYENLAAWGEVCKAFDELGENSPRKNTPKELLTTGLQAISVIFMLITKMGTNTKNVKLRKRYEVFGILNENGLHLAYFVDSLVLMQFMVRALFYSLRAGDQRGKMWCYTVYAVTIAIMGFNNVGLRLIKVAEAMVLKLEDQFAYARFMAYKRFLMLINGDVRASDLLMTEHRSLFERWYSPSTYIQFMGLAQYDMIFRGLIPEAQTSYEASQFRVKHIRESSMIKSPLIHYRILPILDAINGEFLKAKSAVQDYFEEIKTKPTSKDEILGTLTADVLISWLSNENYKTRPEADFKVEKFNNILSALSVDYFSKYLYLAQAHLLYSRLANSQQLDKKLLHAFDKALTLLKLSAQPTLNIKLSHYYVLRGAYCRLKGQTQRATKMYNQAEELAYTINSPWVIGLVAKEKSLLYKDPVRRNRHLELVHDLVQKFNLRRILKVEVAAKSSATIISSDTSTATMTSGRLKDHKNEAYLRALLQVSLSALSVVDPQRIAQLVLGEIVNILGAERAIIFLKDEKDGDLQIAARHGYGESETDLKYSRTVVQKVLSEAETLIVGCSENGELISSQSILAQGIRSVICAPLKVHADTYGVVYLDSRIVRGVFRQEDSVILQAMANQVAISIVTAKTAKAEIDKMEYEKDMTLLSTVQQMLLPAESKKVVHDVKVAAFYQPAQSCGGDWWTCTEPTNGEFHVMLGDVSGHGPASAMVTSIVSSTFACMNKIEPNTPFKQKLKFVSDQLLDTSKGQYLMTLCSLEINVNKKTVTTVGAGSPDIILVKKSGEVSLLDTFGTPLGMSDFDVTETVLNFEKGDRLFFCTDGIIEHAVNGRPIGLKYIFKMLGDTKGSTFEDCYNTIATFIAGACKKHPQDDDITFVLIEF